MTAKTRLTRFAARWGIIGCLVFGIETTNARASEATSVLSSSADELWAPYLLFSGATALADRSELQVDGFHLGLATLWSLLTIAESPRLRLETMLGLDALGGSWDNGYLFSLGVDCGVALRAGSASAAFFAMATWLPAMLITQPASADTYTTPIGYRLLIGMSWYQNNFGLGWRSIDRAQGYPYRALEGFFGIGF
ncbi:MAG: hypothetical protein JXA30_03650 [Deltaproteobacteria bacterium]|nr:hypothetical protein [Deltaproteobacteria bacterium]